MSDVQDMRLHELEIKLTFLDDTVSGLSAADAQLSQRLADIERLLTNMRNELAALRANSDHDASSEPPPPHY